MNGDTFEPMHKPRSYGGGSWTNVGRLKRSYAGELTQGKKKYQGHRKPLKEARVSKRLRRLLNGDA